MHGLIKFVVFGLAAGLLVSACSGEATERQRVSAADQCDGALSSDAAHALEMVLRTKKFDHDPVGGLDRSVEQLTADYAKRERLTTHPPMCRASAPGSVDRVDIDFGLYRERDLFGDVHPYGLHAYDMGLEAQSGPQKAYLFVRCASPRLDGSQERAARIRGVLRFSNAELPDTPAIREANLTVLHSVTLAVVKKLRCENSAGLSDKPVFKPK
ncbi:hypothetical protein [Streptomyces sp. NPDC053431]|uniref:hypothetical protein n=1 Tax=Streptomyces sp. NPDC053431 TaxID=3365703 RepID=UPI0037D2E702